MIERRRRCLVCGANHATCGPAEDVEPVDLMKRSPTVAGEALQRYEIPGRPGHYLRLTEKMARARGMIRPEQETPAAAAVEESSREELYERAQALDIPGRSSMTKEELAAAVAAAQDALSAPEGAMMPGGPTARARARKAAQAAATTAQVAQDAPASDDEADEAVGEPDGDEKAQQEAETKKRPAPGAGAASRAEPRSKTLGVDNDQE